MNDTFNLLEKPLLFNRVSLDSLRSNITKKRLKSLENLSEKFWLDSHKTELESECLINQIERKRYKGKPKSNKSTSIKVMELDKNNHAHSYLIAKTTQELNIQSNYKKVELSTNGLAQLYKPPKKIYKILYNVFNPLKLETLDLCIDIQAPLPKIKDLLPFCDSKFICRYDSGIYLNSPTMQNIQRVVIYNKAKKHKIKAKWLRVEFTCKAHTKLRGFTPPYNQIYDFMEGVFNQSFTVNEYEKQYKLLTDGRSYNKRVIATCFIFWLTSIYELQSISGIF